MACRMVLSMAALRGKSPVLVGNRGAALEPFGWGAATYVANFTCAFRRHVGHSEGSIMDSSGLLLQAHRSVRDVPIAATSLFDTGLRKAT